PVRVIDRLVLLPVLPLLRTQCRDLGTHECGTLVHLLPPWSQRVDRPLEFAGIGREWVRFRLGLRSPVRDRPDLPPGGWFGDRVTNLGQQLRGTPDPTAG